MSAKLLPRASCRLCRTAVAWTSVLVALALVAGCTPEPPGKERPPEPRAAGHTQLRDAIQAPIERASQVEIDTEKAAAAQREAIEAATGG